MKELIDFIARSLVNDPMQVEVTSQQQGATTDFQLRVARDDMGRVIGKRGRVANAMRSLLHVAAAQEGKKSSLDILEPR